MSFNNTSNPEYSEYIARSRYARWIDKEERRETWDETVDRLCSFWESKYPEYAVEIRDSIQPAINNLEVMPSMRSLMTAGEALNRDHVAGYNCLFKSVDHPRVFDEIMYILMCGTGVGFSVERQYIAKLPEVAESMHDTDSTIVFSDSKIGWASGYRELISLLYAGKIPRFDFSRIRPAGAKLRTFGGRASGPRPLQDLCSFTTEVFRGAAGRKLNSLECHDVVCKIAEIVVVGGVRRSALISLSNVSDDRMRYAKSGQWWLDNPQRALANNSAVYTEKPEFEVFLKEMMALHESKSGERGLFSRVAAQKQAAKNGRRDETLVVGTNPCSEILLRDGQFCNLSEVVVRAYDSLQNLLDKVEVSTVLGTFQSTLTSFRYLRALYQKNTEEERLLGVSLTGIMDHPVLNGSEGEEVLIEWLNQMREHSVNVNREWASLLGISPSAAITCVN